MSTHLQYISQAEVLGLPAYFTPIDIAVCPQDMKPN